MKYTIKSAKDIYKAFYPEPSFLVPGMIPLKGLTILAGPYKGCKSWFILFLCMTLSRSGMFLGTFVLDTHKGLYLALEDSYARLNHRMHCLGFEPGDNCLISTSFPSGVDGLNALTKLLSEDRTIEYVVIDTLGRFSSGRGRGSYQEDYDWMAWIKNISDELGIAIILVTHTRKMVDDRDEYNEISGSCGSMAVADAILVLKKTRNSGNGTLACTGRDFEEKKYEVFFSKDSCCWTIKGESGDSASTPERQSILEVLKEHGEMTPQEVSSYIDRTPKAVSNILAKLKDEGLVEKGSKYGTWVSSKPTVSTTSSVSSTYDRDLRGLTHEQRGAII
jgi:DNA-binding transcriptional ArsR family regulator